jgi:hypothetical protein
MDRRDGTGRGRRGDRKAGQGRGGWGGSRPAKEEAGADEQTKDTTAEEETKQAAREPEPVEEEEEEVGFTLDDYIAQKQAKSKGLLPAETKKREHEKISEKVADRSGDKERVKMIDTQLTWKEGYATRPDANANLLGFQARDEDDFEPRGRGRGGRGGRDQGPREPRQGGGRKGRGGRLVVDDSDFPAL